MNPAIRATVFRVTRILLGGLFVYAGVKKLMGSGEFSDAIAGFEIIPNPLVNIAAQTFPILEIVLGVIVLIHRKSSLRIGALGLVLLNLVFLGVLSSAWLRGLNVDCSCFGFDGSTPANWKIPIAILRDLIFLSISVIIWKVSTDIPQDGRKS